MTETSNPLEQVVRLLLSHGFSNAAEDLQSLMENLSNGEGAQRVAAADAIEQRANPRWLGDLYLDGLKLEEWWGLLERAAEYARKAARPHRR